MSVYEVGAPAAMTLLGLCDEVLFELFDVIVSSKDFNHLLLLRLVCGKFDELLTAAMARAARRLPKDVLIDDPLPFHNVTIRPSHSSIELLTKVSNHRHLRHVVGKVEVILRPLDLVEISRDNWLDHDWDANDLKTMMTVDLPERQLRNMGEPSTNDQASQPAFTRMSSIFAHRKSTYILYRENLSLQRKLLSDQSLLQTLRLALAPEKMPRLITVELFEPDTQCPRTDFAPDLESEHGSLDDQLIIEHKKELYKEVRGVKSNSDAHYGLFHLILNVLSQRRNVLYLHIHSVDVKMFEGPGITQVFEPIPGFFQDLRWALISFQSYGTTGLELSAKKWNGFVQMCSNLTHLSINYIPVCGQGDKGSGDSRLAECLSGLRLPNLTHLCLTNFCISTEVLTSLLINHKSTLEVLLLNALVSMDDDEINWKPMLKKLRKELTLEDAILMFWGPYLDKIILDDEMLNIVDIYAEGVTPALADSTSYTVLELLQACTCGEEEEVRDEVVDLGRFLVKKSGDVEFD